MVSAFDAATKHTSMYLRHVALTGLSLYASGGCGRRHVSKFVRSGH